MAQVKLLKKISNYTDKDGNERTATNFFVECGDVLVPVEVKYFEDKETGRDDRSRERKVLMSAFAEELPERPTQNKAKSTNGQAKNEDKATQAAEKGKKPTLQTADDDGDIPY